MNSYFLFSTDKKLYTALNGFLDTARVAEIAFHVTHENLGSPAECPVHQYDLKDVILSISHDA